MSKVQDKFASISFNQWAKQIGNKKREKYIKRGAVLRAFPTYLGCILYFTTLKSIFSIIHTHFYITPYIPFSTLQSIILKYYKIILFLYIFFHTPTKPTAKIKTAGPINHNLNNLINNPAQPRSTTHSPLLNHGNHP